jgi:hypothetical protein
MMQNSTARLPCWFAKNFGKCQAIDRILAITSSRSIGKLCGEYQSDGTNGDADCLLERARYRSRWTSLTRRGDPQTIRISDSRGYFRSTRPHFILETVTFDLDRAEILPSQTKLLDLIGRVVRSNPTLQIELQPGQTPSEIGTLAQARSVAVSSYLQDRWQIPADRVTLETESAPASTVRINTTIKSSKSISDNEPINTVK